MNNSYSSFVCPVAFVLMFKGNIINKKIQSNVIFVLENSQTEVTVQITLEHIQEKNRMNAISAKESFQIKKAHYKMVERCPACAMSAEKRTNACTKITLCARLTTLKTNQISVFYAIVRTPPCAYFTTSFLYTSAATRIKNDAIGGASTPALTLSSSSNEILTLLQRIQRPGKIVHSQIQPLLTESTGLLGKHIYEK